jgi:hypothetical protein
MTIGTVRLALSGLAKLLDQAGVASQAKDVSALDAFLRPHDNAATTVFLKKAAPKRDVGASWTGRRVGDVFPILETYCDVVGHLATKSACKEFVQLIEFLRRYERSGLSEFIEAAQEALATSSTSTSRVRSAPTNESLVAEYTARLKTALGSDEQFESAFAALKLDKAARTQEVVEIARRMMSSPPVSLDKKKSMGAIQDLHRAAKGFDLKLKAMAGRSAA